jgi:hypothetical protein
VSRPYADPAGARHMVIVAAFENCSGNITLRAQQRVTDSSADVSGDPDSCAQPLGWPKTKADCQHGERYLTSPGHPAIAVSLAPAFTARPRVMQPLSFGAHLAFLPEASAGRRLVSGGSGIRTLEDDRSP